MSVVIWAVVVYLFYWYKPWRTKPMDNVPFTIPYCLVPPQDRFTGTAVVNPRIH
jgi:hypothetical protein